MDGLASNPDIRAENRATNGLNHEKTFNTHLNFSSVQYFNLHLTENTVNFRYKTNCLMLYSYREVMDVYSESLTEHCVLCGQNAEM